MHRLVILSSAAIALSGCSFLNGSSHSHSETYSQPQSSAYSHNCGTPSGTTYCAPGSTNSVGHNTASHGHQSEYGHQSDYGHHSDYQGQYGYDAPQQPSTQAYGQAHSHAPHGHQGHGHQGHGNSYGHAPQLRGPHGPSRRQGYKYGTLGAIAYDLGEDIYGIQGRLGYQSANYWGAEVEGSFGIVSEEDLIGTTEFRAGVDYSVGAFLRGTVPLGNQFNVFGRVGYHATEIEGSATDATGTIEFSDTADGFAYGAGAEYALSPRDSLRLDYTRYDLGAGDTDSLAIAYARKF